jgi:hypothetical protein
MLTGSSPRSRYFITGSSYNLDDGFTLLRSICRIRR